MGDEISNVEWMRMLESAEEELRQTEKKLKYQKYKRCLAMARWCDDAARLATWDKDYHRCGWYNKWMRCWLKIAEKFKPNKEAK